MKCPSCGKELERMKRQVGTTESGDPIFNEYAVCRDCKKQWNLDRQRARKIAAKKEAEQAEAKPVDKAESKVAVRPAESSVSKKGAAEGSRKESRSKTCEKTQTDRRRRKTCTSEGFKTDQ